MVELGKRPSRRPAPPPYGSAKARQKAHDKRTKEVEVSREHEWAVEATKSAREPSELDRRALCEMGEMGPDDGHLTSLEPEPHDDSATPDGIPGKLAEVDRPRIEAREPALERHSPPPRPTGASAPRSAVHCSALEAAAPWSSRGLEDAQPCRGPRERTWPPGGCPSRRRREQQASRAAKCTDLDIATGREKAGNLAVTAVLAILPKLLREHEEIGIEAPGALGKIKGCAPPVYSGMGVETRHGELRHRRRGYRGQAVRLSPEAARDFLG